MITSSIRICQASHTAEPSSFFRNDLVLNDYWKRTFSSENPSNTFRLRRRNLKKQQWLIMTSHFEFVENHITIVTPSFSKNPGFRFFRPHWNARLTFSMSSVWGAFSKTSVFVTLKVKTAGMTVELKLRFQISLAKSMNLKVKVLCFYCVYQVFSFGSLTKYFFIFLFRQCLISTPSQKKAV